MDILATRWTHYLPTIYCASRPDTFQEMSTFFCHPIIPAHSCMDIERSSFDPNESDLVGA